MEFTLQRQTIPSGHFFAGPSGPTLLQSFLGTCVGVAAFDRKNAVGGMIHLLLPEPSGTGAEKVDARYARSGIPLFVQALYEAGAAREQLAAVIAGGALVGPLSATDLDLNIGGRTADLVQALLTEEGIPVVHWETGGFFTCSLNLAMDTWAYRIEPLGQENTTAAVPARLPQAGDIQQAMIGLQPVPQVALKIMQMIDSGTGDARALAEEIKKDQVISARTLQLCNSAMFARKNRIESLDHALVFLGENILVRMILSAAVKNFFDAAGQGGYSLCMGGLYHHAVGTAVTAEKIAHFTGEAPLATAYTAGLLHDIGKVVLDQYIAGAYPLFYRKLDHEEEHSSAVERDMFGIDHTAVGSRLAEMWAFPESLVEVIAHHHEPENAPRHGKLAGIVFLADLLMSRFNAGLELEGISTGSLKDHLKRVGLKARHLASIIDLIPHSLFDTQRESSAMSEA